MIKIIVKLGLNIQTLDLLSTRKLSLPPIRKKYPNRKLLIEILSLIASKETNIVF